MISYNINFSINLLSASPVGMSSETLLEEIKSTLAPVQPGYLTKHTAATEEKLNSLIVAEQVRISSLKRQNELVNKLAKELPARVSGVDKEIQQAIVNREELEKLEKSRNSDIQKITARKLVLEKQFKEVTAALRAKRQDEAAALFQKDQVWELITRVVDLRKQVTRYCLKSPSEKASATDMAYLSMRIDKNDALLKEIESRLSDIEETQFR